MNTISVTRDSVIDYQPVMEHRNRTRHEHPVIVSSRDNLTKEVLAAAAPTRAEALCFWVLAACGAGSAAWGLGSIPALAREWPGVEAFVKSIVG
jgi:hypothetical protein